MCNRHQIQEPIPQFRQQVPTKCSIRAGESEGLIGHHESGIAWLGLMGSGPAVGEIFAEGLPDQETGIQAGVPAMCREFLVVFLTQTNCDPLSESSS